MLNGITGAGAVCCQYASENYGGVPADTKPVSIGGVQVNVPRSPKGLLGQIGKAFNDAVHGGDGTVSRNAVQALVNSAARTYSGGANVVPFPMVNPFKPVIATGAPVTGLTRWPNRFTYEVENTDSEPDDEQSSFDGLSGITGIGLGAPVDEIGLPPPPPVYVPRVPTGPSTLQTILGTIQATLPATIQSFRANPSNIFPGTAYNPYTTNYPGASYPGSAPYSTNGAAEGVGAGVGRAADTLGGTISRFVTEHPYLVIGGGAALVLLFMNPPRRR